MDILSLDLELNKKQSGYTKLEGPGIVITMYDNLEDNPFILDVNDEIIHDVDVLNLLNDLRIAGAEAISINNERVLSTSEIKCGGPIIRVNNRSYGTPFVIRAIGDPKVLMASINAPGTYGDMLKNIYMIGIETEEKDKLTIPAYRGVFNFRYAKPVGEGD